MGRAWIVAACLLLVGCNQSHKSEVDGYAALARHVAGNRVGHDADSWIEMRNSAGEWERTGLVFGYIGDHEECEKAIAGLKKVNYARQYRCVPAN